MPSPKTYITKELTFQALYNSLPLTISDLPLGTKAKSNKAHVVLKRIEGQTESLNSMDETGLYTIDNSSKIKITLTSAKPSPAEITASQDLLWESMQNSPCISQKFLVAYSKEALPSKHSKLQKFIIASLTLDADYQFTSYKKTKPAKAAPALQALSFGYAKIKGTSYTPSNLVNTVQNFPPPDPNTLTLTRSGEADSYVLPEPYTQSYSPLNTIQATDIDSDLLFCDDELLASVAPVPEEQAPPIPPPTFKPSPPPYHVSPATKKTSHQSPAHPSLSNKEGPNRTQYTPTLHAGAIHTNTCNTPTSVEKEGAALKAPPKVPIKPSTKAKSVSFAFGTKTSFEEAQSITKKTEQHSTQASSDTTISEKREFAGIGKVKFNQLLTSISPTVGEMFPASISLTKYTNHNISEAIEPQDSLTPPVISEARITENHIIGNTEFKERQKQLNAALSGNFLATVSHPPEDEIDSETATNSPYLSYPSSTSQFELNINPASDTPFTAAPTPPPPPPLPSIKQKGDLTKAPKIPQEDALAAVKLQKTPIKETNEESTPSNVSATPPVPRKSDGQLDFNALKNLIGDKISFAPRYVPPSTSERANENTEDYEVQTITIGNGDDFLSLI